MIFAHFAITEYLDIYPAAISTVYHLRNRHARQEDNGRKVAFYFSMALKGPFWRWKKSRPKVPTIIHRYPAITKPRPG